MPVNVLDVFAIITWVALPLGLYEAGRRRLHSRGSAFAGPGALAATTTGLAVIGASLAPSMSGALERSFAGHMVQHLALGLVGPLMLVVGRAGDVLPWALPARPRHALHRTWRGSARWRGAPLTAGCSLLAAWYLWHVPGFHDAAVHVPAMHVAQHLTLLAAAGWFWAVVSPHRRRGGVAVLALFGVSLGTGLLGGVLSLSPTALYDAYAVEGPSALADQHLGGLLMWTPGGLIYLLAAVVQVVRWLGVARVDDAPPLRLSRREVRVS